MEVFHYIPCAEIAAQIDPDKHSAVEKHIIDKTNIHDILNTDLCSRARCVKLGEFDEYYIQADC
jgi:hypothetical protein